MIQRIQSVYLLIGALCLAALSLVGDLRQTEAFDTLAWYAPLVAVVGAATIVMAIVAIFLYKNRRRQLTTILVLQMMTVGFMVVLYGGLFLAGDFATYRAGTAELGTLLALLLPAVAYVFFYLARKGVQRDVDLVKSMDRLR